MKMDIDNILKSECFDSDKAKKQFKFNKISAIQKKDLNSSHPLVNTITCEDMTSNKKKRGIFGLNGSLITYFEDEHSKCPKSALDINYARLKSLPSEENDPKYGFVVAKYGKAFIFYFDEKETAQKWIKALKSICVLVDFHEEYKVIQMLGQGSFARVYLVESRTSGDRFAAKAISKEVEDPARKVFQKASLSNEIGLLRSLDHKNIVKLYEVYETTNTIFLVMELIKGKTLQKILQDPSFLQTFPENRLFKIIYSILEALDFLASQKIIHRDIKPANILVQEKTGTVKIVDFGLATKLGESRHVYKQCGTPGYIPPEVFEYDSKKSATFYNDRYDAFSAGSVLFYLLFGQPFINGKEISLVHEFNKDMNNLKTSISNIATEIANPFSSINKQGLELLLELLKLDKNQRISASEALKHPYLVSLANKGLEPPSADYPLRYSFERFNTGDFNFAPASDFYLPDPKLGLSSQSPTEIKHIEKNILFLGTTSPDLNELFEASIDSPHSDSLFSRCGSLNTNFNSFSKQLSLKDKGHQQNFRLLTSSGSQQMILKAALLNTAQKNSQLLRIKTAGELKSVPDKRYREQHSFGNYNLDAKFTNNQSFSNNSSGVEADIGDEGDEGCNLETNFVNLNKPEFKKQSSKMVATYTNFSNVSITHH